MDIEFEKVTSENEVVNLVPLAREIFREHFPPVIGSDQTEYMIERFLNPEAILRDIKHGYEYYTIMAENSPIGYFSVLMEPDEKYMNLCKIYVRKEYRKTGAGNRVLNLIIQKCRENGLLKIRLVVNINNKGPIAWYESKGFKIKEMVKKDIGDGFFMDDFLMEKEIL